MVKSGDNKQCCFFDYCSCDKYTPMIPLGLKETKELDFSVPFKVSLTHTYINTHVYAHTQTHKCIHAHMCI